MARRLTKSSPGPLPCDPSTVRYIDPSGPMRDARDRGSNYFSGQWAERTTVADAAARGPGGTYLATRDRWPHEGPLFRVVRFGIDGGVSPVSRAEACAAGAWGGILPPHQWRAHAEYRTMAAAVTAARDLAACPAAWAPRLRILAASHVGDLVTCEAFGIDPVTDDPGTTTTPAGVSERSPGFGFSLGFVGPCSLTPEERAAVLSLVSSALYRAEVPAAVTASRNPAPEHPAAKVE